MINTTISQRLCLPNQALLFDLDALYVQLHRVKDRRHRRGIRYPLAEVLLIGILAKLAGQTSSRAIAEWAQLRQSELADLFALRRKTMPHFSTWSRILSAAVDPGEVEEVVGRFFAKQVNKPLQPGQLHLCLDGKTLKGTIPLGESQGVHLLAAYLPKEGVVLAQVQVSTSESRGECCSPAACYGGSTGNGRERGCHFRFSQAQSEDPTSQRGLSLDD